MAFRLDGLEWWRAEPGGAAWLERLPRLVAEVAETWSLSLGPPFLPLHVSWVAPATSSDGREAVLKVNFPEPESEHEADALAAWGGDGAARLYAHDAERRALLVERCRPGRQLWDVDDEDEANRLAAGVLRRLHRVEPPPGLRLLADEAARWAAVLPGRWERVGRPCDRALLDEAVALAGELAVTQPRLALCHQDFHGGNVLESARGGWLAIDPKPLAGDPAFDAASLLRDRREALHRDPDAARRVRRRLDLLAAELALDRERLRGWGIVHALAWGLSDTEVFPGHLEAAELLSRA